MFHLKGNVVGKKENHREGENTGGCGDAFGVKLKSLVYNSWQVSSKSFIY